MDLWRRTILKFYNRILGGRDYTLFEVVRYGMQLPPVLSTFGDVQNASLSSWRALRDRRRVAASQDEAAVLKLNKSEYFNRRGTLTRPSTITEANLRDISFYAFWRQFYCSNKRLVKRQKERFLSKSGTGHPGCANRSNPEHEFYARRTLYAYMPCAGLRGLDCIDEVVQVVYNGSWSDAFRAFVEDDADIWCPTWIRKNYKVLHDVVEQANADGETVPTTKVEVE